MFDTVKILTEVQVDLTEKGRAFWKKHYKPGPLITYDSDTRFISNYNGELRRKIEKVVEDFNKSNDMINAVIVKDKIV